jgi:hypothetical protein
MFTWTPAFAPEAAGPWKWAAVAAPDSPENSIIHDNSFVAGSKSTDADPVASVSTGGTS